MKKIWIAAAAIIAAALVILNIRYETYAVFTESGTALSGQTLADALGGSPEEAEKITIKGTAVNAGQFLYAMAGRYYVGEEKKTEINVDMPLFTGEQSLFLFNNSATLYTQDFLKETTITGMVLSGNRAYNQNHEAIDENIYIFLALSNGLHVGLSEIQISDRGVNTVIGANATMRFSETKLSWYTWDEEAGQFHYGHLQEISEDAKITILDRTYLYKDVLTYLGKVSKASDWTQVEPQKPEPVEPDVQPEEPSEGDTENTGEDTDSEDHPPRENQNKPPEVIHPDESEAKKPDRVINPDDFVERPVRHPETGENPGEGTAGGDPVERPFELPKVSCEDFEGQFYSATSSVSIEDPSGRIIGGIVFVLEADNFYARKTVYSTTDFRINSIRPETDYTVTGKYYYREANGKLEEVVFYTGKVSTKPIQDLPSFSLSYEKAGYKSNRIELENFGFTLNEAGTDMKGWESISGISRMEWGINRAVYPMNYAVVNSLVSGNQLEVFSSVTSLEANVRYTFYFRCYDMYAYELPLTWPTTEPYSNRDVTWTCKERPSARLVKESVATSEAKYAWNIYANPDNVECEDLRWELSDVTDRNHVTTVMGSLTGGSGRIELNNLLSDHSYRLTLTAICDLGADLEKERMTLAVAEFSTVPILNLGYYYVSSSSTVEENSAHIMMTMDPQATNAELLRCLNSVTVYLRKDMSAPGDPPLDTIEISAATLGEENFARFLNGEYVWELDLTGLDSNTKFNLNYVTKVVEGSGANQVIYEGRIGIINTVGTFTTLKKTPQAVLTPIFANGNLLVFEAGVTDVDGAIGEDTVLLQVQKAVVNSKGTLVPGQAIYTERLAKGEPVSSREVSQYLEGKSTYFVTLTADSYNRGDKAYTSYNLATIQMETKEAITGRLTMLSLDLDGARYQARLRVEMKDLSGAATGRFYVDMFRNGELVSGRTYDSDVFDYLNQSYTRDFTMPVERDGAQYELELYTLVYGFTGQAYHITLGRYSFDSKDIIREIVDEETLYQALGQDGRWVMTKDVTLAPEEPKDETQEFEMLTNKDLSAFGNVRVGRDPDGSRYFQFGGTSSDYMTLSTIPVARNINWEDGFKIETTVTWEAFKNCGAIFSLGSGREDGNTSYNYWNHLSVAGWSTTNPLYLSLRSYMNGTSNHILWHMPNDNVVPSGYKISANDKVTLRFEVVRTAGDSYSLYTYYKFEKPGSSYSQKAQKDVWYALSNPQSGQSLTAVIGNIERTMNYIGRGYSNGNGIYPFQGKLYSLEVWTADADASTECGLTRDQYTFTKASTASGNLIGRNISWWYADEKASVRETGEVEAALDTGWYQIIKLDFPADGYEGGPQEPDPYKQNYYATRIANYFQGSIDFQGYCLKNTGSLRPVLSQLGTEGTISNLVYDTGIQQDQVTNMASVFMKQNNGTLDNVYVSYQGTTKYPHTNVGAICAYNYGKISNFVVILEGNVYIGGETGMVAVRNYGDIRNGYVSSISSTYAIQAVSAATPARVGGLCGWNAVSNNGSHQGNIQSVYVNLNMVMATSPQTVGLVIGEAAGTASYAYSNGTLTYGNGLVNKDRGPAVGWVTGSTPAANNPALSRLTYVSDNAYTGSNSTKYNSKSFTAYLYDPAWQAGTLNQTGQFLIEDMLKLFLFPQVKLNVCMPEQPLINLPVIKDAITITSVEVLEQTRGTARLGVYAHERDGQMDIAGIKFAGGQLTATVIEGSQTDRDADGFIYFEVDVEVFTSSSNVGYYGDSYTISQIDYYPSKYSEKTKSVTASFPVSVTFWKEIWCITGDGNGDGVKDGWKETIKKSPAQNYILMTDLDMSGVSAQDITVGSLSGRLDGSGHTLRNINLDGQAAFINGVGLNGSIFNLNLKNVSMLSPTQGSVSLFGTVYNEIRNVSVDGIRLEGYSYIASIAARMAGRANLTNISVKDVAIDFYDDTSRLATAYVGGLVAHMEDTDGQNLSVSHCFVRGLDLKVSDCSGSAGIGGLIGRIYQRRGTYRADYYKVQDCYVEGTMNVRANYVGGIVGYTDDQQGYLYVQNLYSKVDMMVEGNYVGGLVGHMGTSVPYHTDWNCMVLGTVNFLTDEDNQHLFFGKTACTSIDKLYTTDAVKVTGQLLYQNGSYIGECDGTGTGASFMPMFTILNKAQMLQAATYANCLGSSFRPEFKTDGTANTAAYLPSLYASDGVTILPLQEEKISAYEEAVVALTLVTKNGVNFEAHFTFPTGYVIEEVTFLHMKSHEQWFYQTGPNSGYMTFSRNDSQSDYVDNYYINGVWYRTDTGERAFIPLYWELDFGVSINYVRITTAEEWVTYMTQYAKVYTNYEIAPASPDNVLDLSGVDPSILPKNVKVNRLRGISKEVMTENGTKELKQAVVYGLHAEYTSEGDAPFARAYSRIENLSFDNILLVGNNSSTPLGIVGTCRADVENVNFSNISLRSKKTNGQYIGIFGRAVGSIRFCNIGLENVMINYENTTVTQDGKEVVRINNNMIPTSVKISTSSQRIGGLIGYMSATSSLENQPAVENIRARSLYVYGSYYVGGLIGQKDSNGPEVKTIDAEDIHVTGAYGVGGIIGYVTYGTTRDVDARDVRVTGKQLTGCNSVQYIGGIVGYSNAHNLYGVTLDNSGLHGGTVNPENMADSDYDILLSAGTAANRSYAGGVVGRNYNSSMRDITVKQVYVKSDGGATGGLAGESYSITMGSTSADTAVARDMLVDGGIVRGVNGVGGMFGQLYYGNLQSSTGSGTLEVITDYDVRNTYVSGSGTNIGGAAGYSVSVMRNFHVKDSTVVATGEALTDTSASFCGGVVGKLAQTLYSCGVENTQVTSACQYTGGVVGGTDTGSYNLEGCYVNNHASGADAASADKSISGQQYVGGLIGLANRNTHIYKFKVNAEVVSENTPDGKRSAAGGVAGLYEDADYILKYNSQNEPIYTYAGCYIVEGYVAGSVQAAQAAGGLVGVSSAGENTEKQIENLYLYSSRPRRVVVALERLEVKLNSGVIGYGAANRSDFFGFEVSRNMGTGLLSPSGRGVRIYDGTEVLRAGRDVSDQLKRYTYYKSTADNNYVLQAYSETIEYLDPAGTDKTLQPNSWKTLFVTLEQLAQKSTYYGTTTNGFFTTTNYFTYRHEDNDSSKELILMPDLKLYTALDNNNRVPASSFQGEVSLPRAASSLISGNQSSTMSSNSSGGPGTLIYTSGVAQINLECQDDSLMGQDFAVYVNGTQVSSGTFLDRVYTIGYNFRDSLQIQIGEELLTVGIKDICRDVMVWKDQGYYLADEGVYAIDGDEPLLTGEFVNLYQGKALASDGTIYDVVTGNVAGTIAAAGETGSLLSCGQVAAEAQPLVVSLVNGVTVHNFATFSRLEGQDRKRAILQYVETNFGGEHVFSLRNTEGKVTADSIVMRTQGDVQYRTLLQNGTIVDVGNTISPLLANEDVETSGVQYLTMNCSITEDHDLVIIRYRDGGLGAYHYLTGQEILFIEGETQPMGFMTFLFREIGSFLTSAQSGAGTQMVEQASENTRLQNMLQKDEELLSSLVAEVGMSNSVSGDQTEGAGTAGSDGETENDRPENSDGQTEQKPDGSGNQNGEGQTGQKPEEKPGEKPDQTGDERPEQGENADDTVILTSVYNADTSENELHAAEDILQDVSAQKSLNELALEQGLLLNHGTQDDMGDQDRKGILLYVAVFAAVVGGTLVFAFGGRKKKRERRNG